jgi:hypothetical protein
MAQRTAKLGQGSIFLRNDWWWCDYTAGGVRRRESCKTKDREEALAYLHRRQGKLASGEFLAPDRVRVKDLLMLLLEDYDVRGVAQAYIAGLKVKSIIGPKLGNIKAAKLTTAQVKDYIRERRKKVAPGTVNRELGMLHRAYQLGYQQDPPLVARVPFFPKLPEAEPRKGFLKPELYNKLLLTLPEELRLLFVVAYHVGLRKGALLRIKWSQVDMAASCIWMEGKRPNRKPGQSLCPSMATWRSSWSFSRGKVSTCLHEARSRFETSARGGTKPVRKPVFRASCSTICAGPQSAISVERESQSR